jgi:hypothetical protein
VPHSSRTCDEWASFAVSKRRSYPHSATAYPHFANSLPDFSSLATFAAVTLSDMRKQWFGDSRDYVKWSVIYRESEPDLQVLYVAMARPDELKGDVHPFVQAFFDIQKDFCLVKGLFKERITVISDEYSNRKHSTYFQIVIESLTELQKSGPTVVFLDPDTGIEPKSGPKDQHVRLDDIEMVAQRLHPRSRVIVYQHATQDKRVPWEQHAREKLISILEPDRFLLRIGKDTPRAHDVCFLIAEAL